MAEEEVDSVWLLEDAAERRVQAIKRKERHLYDAFARPYLLRLRGGQET